MKCEELLTALNQYVDGAVDPGICDPFQEHLKGCNPCRIVVDNIRQTIKLFKAEEPFELPPTLQQRLDRLLREHWKGKIDTDQPLVEQAKAGDFAAMESLLVKYERQIFGVVRRIVQQHQDAEEVTWLARKGSMQNGLMRWSISSLGCSACRRQVPTCVKTWRI